MRGAAILLSAVLAAASAAEVDLKEDPPLLKPPKAGEVTGTIAPAGAVAKIALVSRDKRKTYAGTFDAKTGAFRFRDLPGDAAYDVCLALKGGREIEGIDLDFADARMLRLAEARRKQLGLPAERRHAFTQADADELAKYVTDLAKQDFMNVGRAVYIKGHGTRATMLVELLRTKPDYAGDARFIWRLELWYLKHQFGGWERLTDQEKLIRRLRIPQQQWQQYGIEFFPELSVRVDADGKSPPVKFAIPEAGDSTRGRLPRTEPVLNVKPRVLGLDKKD